MLHLCNLISNKKLKNQVMIESQSRITLSFYKYFNICNPILFRNNLYIFFNRLNILGRVYIAQEGINAQISVPEKIFFSFSSILSQFSSIFDDIHINQSIDNSNFSFWVLRIKVRKKIVSDGLNDTKFNIKKTGIYLNAESVNNMYSDPESVFVDMRNSYEYKIGHFDRAINIKKNTFRDQLKIIIDELIPYKYKNIVMYCTGGIRCEKSSAWLKYHNFKYVYQIKNGIIGYIHEARKKNLPIYFKGKNFVFDSRLVEKISDDVISYCRQCNCPCDSYVNCNYQKCHLLFIQCIKCNYKFNQCCSYLCQNKLNNYKK
ncbi:tRNA uridine(34) hydroxylase [Buchnera aphidicola (Eriosoma grossulariae)]|uniref:oxygen-dependent tRNA uridine(34) hydroxylase TrhO n=1 Tax=Buchnera aphidicola TaxID=9 RepID=UPI003463EFFD